ncbi:hypothetical protein [Vibrio sp. Isolate24]|uniref:hypothetical protein n=1 Tax=Vibrio sp. Isolate24 TaxID=2908534 RepID=UPI001EFE40D6|nr:hypothetical protein [Vibrio sp. Isolate24]MCG9680937.1 hypothetical protein [Vibrio sp. Isolate24]
MKISDFYDENDEIKSVLSQGFISLWRGWLTREEAYKLNQVDAYEVERFKQLIRLLYSKYDIYRAEWDSRTLHKINNIDSFLSDYPCSFEGGDFVEIFIPSLDLLIKETYDYTFIFWYKENKVQECISSLASQVRLYTFN